MSGDMLLDVHPGTRRLAAKLRDEYLAYLNAHPDEPMPRERVMELLVEQPAPEFYLEWRSVFYALEREIKKVRQRWDT